MKQRKYARLSINSHYATNQSIFIPPSRIQSSETDISIAREIIAIYHVIGETKEKSGEWIYIDEKKRQDFVSALQSNNELLLADCLVNFFIDNASYGIITPASSELNESSIDVILDDIDAAIEFGGLKNFDSIKLMIGSSGNPFGLLLEDDIIIQLDAPRHFYYAHLIDKILSRTNKKSIIEIGGGFGGLVRIIRTFNLDNTYYIIDLIETGILAYYFLKKSNVPVEIVTSLPLDVKPGVVYIIPTNIYKDIKYLDIGLVVNFNSFSEMSVPVVDEYFEFIQEKVKPDFILHQNSNFLLFPNSERHIEYLSDDFPIDDKKYKLYSKFISPFHGGGGRYRIYEYSRITNTNS
jgi:hypothetical protein